MISTFDMIDKKVEIGRVRENEPFGVRLLEVVA